MQFRPFPADNLFAADLLMTSTIIVLDSFCVSRYAPHMLKNITLKLDEQIITRIRHVAVDDSKSVSAWVSELIQKTLNDIDEYEQSRREAIESLNQGLHLGGQPLGRDDIHDRR